MNEENVRKRFVVAILIHDMFEDWLECVGVTLESFCTDATGSWWFNYGEALRGVGVWIVLIATTTFGSGEVPTALPARSSGFALAADRWMVLSFQIQR